MGVLLHLLTMAEFDHKSDQNESLLPQEALVFSEFDQKMYINTVVKNNEHIIYMLKKIVSKINYTKSVDLCYDELVNMVTAFVDIKFVYFIIEQMMIFKFLKFGNMLNTIVVDAGRFECFKNINFLINIFYVNPYYLHNHDSQILHLDALQFTQVQPFGSERETDRKSSIEHKVLANLLLLYVDCVYSGSQHLNFNDFIIYF